MIFGTTTATVLKDGLLSILIFISEVAFRWWPATLAVITGSDLPESTPVVDSIIGSLEAERPIPTATGVIVEGTYYSPDGSAVPIPSEGMPVSGTDAPATPVGFAGDTLEVAWNIFAPISIFISLIIATALIYAMIRLLQIRLAEQRALEEAAHDLPATSATSVGAVSLAGAPLPGTDNLVAPPPVGGTPSLAERRWARIQEQIASEEENDWRLAILEADIMLDEALEAIGLPGDTLGEKLKAARAGEGGRFATLDQAWDAHIVRNHLAHRGSGYRLSAREAKRVIGQYRLVFQELGLLE